MSFILHATTCYPEHVVNQPEILSLLKKAWPHKSEVIDEFENTSGVESRYLSLPLNYYRDLTDVGIRNVIWKAEATRLQKKNLKKIFDETRINIADVGLIASVTTTGQVVPGLEVLMMNEFPFEPNIIRLPLFGLGCLAGVAGINRVNDYLSANPKKAALLMATELCSLTFQLEDDCAANAFIEEATMLGDGAGAVLMVGKEHPLASIASFEIMTNQSVFYPETDHGVSPERPRLIKEKIGTSIDEFLNKYKINRESLSYFLAHPSGTSELQALSSTLGINNDQLSLSFESLAKYGNVSSASVINILEKTIEADIPSQNLGLMMAMGPSNLELGLIRKC